MIARHPARRAAVGAALVILFAAYASGAGASLSTFTALNESSNGRVIALNPGGRVTLTLHSTYWKVTALAKQKTLAQLGKVVTVGALPGSTSGCVPGQGCGTVTVHYVANRPGQVRLRATRSTCGEALRCTPSQSLWTVVLRVR